MSDHTPTIPKTDYYYGSKIVKAAQTASNGEPGYEVEYADGYTSWSPKGVFEEAYLCLGDISKFEPHQQRLIAEQVQLDNRLSKLNQFLDKPREETQFVSDHEYAIMENQATKMTELNRLLIKRVMLFDPTIGHAKAEPL